MTPGLVPAPWRMRLGVLLLVAALPWRASLAEESPAREPVPTAPALSVSEAVRRSEGARVRLQHIERVLSDEAAIPALEREIAELSTTVHRTFSDTSRRLAEGPTLSAVRELQEAWRRIAFDLEDAQQILTERESELDALAEKLSQLAKDWGEARAALSEAEGPAAVRPSADDITETLAARRGTVRSRQGLLLELQERLSRGRQRAAEADTEIQKWQRGRANRLFQPDAAPLWRQSALRGATAVEELTRAAGDFVRPLSPYVQKRSAGLLTALLLVLLLALLLRLVHRVMSEWPERTPEVAEFLTIAERPVSAALAVGVVAVLWTNLHAPRAFWMAVAFTGLIAIVRIAERIVEARLVFLVYGLAACAVVGMGRNLLGSSAPLLQLLLVGETLLLGTLTLWVARRRADRFGPRAAGLVRSVGPVLGGLFAVAAALAVCGYLDLIQLLVQFSITSVLLAMAVMVWARILAGLAVWLLRVRPLANLRLVRRNRAWIQHLIGRALVVGAFLLWVFFVLRSVGLHATVLSVMAALLDVGISRGNVTITLRDLMEFGVTLYVAWMLSAFLRFVLEEDVYPRVTLPRGVSYALSTLLHYGVLTLGFFLALGVAGVDLTKATILVSALGIGVGFGLQNIVNNFASGLILLFERPVQVGDAVTIGSIDGQVKHIGMRSSTVRTWDGAEVILPNTALIADPVTNWTLSDRKRRLTLVVGAAYGTDPAVVVDLLKGVAVAHGAVMEEPEPQALFMGFGDSALNFELRAWTDRADAWAPVQSELYLALFAALAAKGIAIPYPQRDVHLDATQPVPVRVVGGDAPRDTA